MTDNDESNGGGSGKVIASDVHRAEEEEWEEGGHERHLEKRREIKTKRIFENYCGAGGATGRDHGRSAMTIL